MQTLDLAGETNDEKFSGIKLGLVFTARRKGMAAEEKEKAAQGAVGRQREEKVAALDKWYADSLEAIRKHGQEKGELDLVVERFLMDVHGSFYEMPREHGLPLIRPVCSHRKAITDSQAVFATKVIGAGVTRADSKAATAVLLIETTQKSKASPQAQVVRFRIEVQLKKVGDRWLLSGISGT